jgi:hypothetical protein
MVSPLSLSRWALWRVRSQYRFVDYARRILEICTELQADRGGMVTQPRGTIQKDIEPL